MRLVICLFLLVIGANTAHSQRDLNDLRMWVRFEVQPGIALRGPYRGTTRFQIGKGPMRAMLRPRIELQVVRNNNVEQHVDLPRLPVFFDWDTRQVANDRYTLRLVAIDPRTQTETVMDEISGKVENAVAEPTPIINSADPSTSVEVPPPSTVVGPPRPRFARHGDLAVSGTFSMPILEWPEGTPARYMPVVDIYRDGRRVDSQGTGGRFPFVLNWDTISTPNGIYTLKLTVINLADNSEISTDEMTVTVQNANLTVPRLESSAGIRPAPISVPSSVLRGTRSSRGSLGSTVGLLRGGSKADQFRWVMMISKAFGDPFPQVAAAQWALESNWGKSQSGKNNYFGIKAVGDQPGTDRPTNEWGDSGIYATTARFADYATPTDGIAARVKFLKKSRYGGYWTAGSADAAARALQRGGYATDPSYASQLIAIMRRMGY